MVVGLVLVLSSSLAHAQEAAKKVDKPPRAETRKAELARTLELRKARNQTKRQAYTKRQIQAQAEAEAEAVAEQQAMAQFLQQIQAHRPSTVTQTQRSGPTAQPGTRPSTGPSAPLPLQSQGGSRLHPKCTRCVPAGSGRCSFCRGSGTFGGLGHDCSNCKGTGQCPSCFGSGAK